MLCKPIIFGSRPAASAARWMAAIARLALAGSLI